MFNKAEKQIVLISLLLLIPITAGLTTYVVFQVRENYSLSASSNGYASPKYLGGLVERLQKSLVTVNCNDGIGSGFSFELDNADIFNGFEYADEITKNAKSVIITNAHVVKDCLEQGSVQIVVDNETSQSGEIVKIDEANDLSMLTLDLEIPPLSGASWKPLPGYWTMALGSPHNFAGSVTFGNIINLDTSSVFHTASLSPGNSGGPLVDNEGYLYGVNTGSKPVGQNFNISIGVNAFCDQLIKCPSSKYWQDK